MSEIKKKKTRTIIPMELIGFLGVTIIFKIPAELTALSRLPTILHPDIARARLPFDFCLLIVLIFLSCILKVVKSNGYAYTMV